MDGADAGQVCSLEEESSSIGRHRDATFQVQDTGISRLHARIFKDAGVHWIEDLESRNGTFVQSERVERSRLEDGDWIQLGPRVSFRYVRTDQKQEQLLRQLYESSTRDGLTGAFNRRHFNKRLDEEVAFATRHGSSLALLILDLDHFKKVNDTYGHPAGDAVLRHVSAIISQRLRGEDVFARFGGEEFAVLLRSVSVRGAAKVAERLRATVATSPVYFDGNAIAVSMSVGCASLECLRAHEGSGLVDVADQRLYKAKQSGRNRVTAGD
jgi:diguanylate cyclase (GGDEF)-like protein